MSTLSFEQAYQRLLSIPNSPKEGLQRILELLTRLNHPQKDLKTIHIAGTNGKGSTAAFAQAILQTQFQKVALFTSPHLHTVRERIQINKKMISESDFCRLEAQITDATAQMLLKNQPTFFEKMTAMAFLYFAEENVDFAVIEVGLGGRLDSTNVLKSELVLITPIALDHQQFLGATLTDIAGEKSGIIKKNSIVWSAEQNIDVDTRINKQVSELKNNIRKLPKLHTLDQLNAAQRQQKIVLLKKMFLSMQGEHQINNATLATLAIYDALFRSKQSFTQFLEEIIPALNSCFWPGRYEKISKDPTIILDGAHNPHAAKTLKKTLCEDSKLCLNSQQKQMNEEILIICGASFNHSSFDFAQALALQKQIIWCTKASMPRSEEASQVAKGYLSAGYKHVRIKEFDGIINQAKTYANKHNLTILITGSLYLVGELRQQILYPDEASHSKELQGI